MADEVWAGCEKAQSFGQTVTVDQICRLPAGDPRPNAAETHHIASHSAEVSLVLVRSVFPVKFGVRLVGVALSDFQNGRQATATQLDLGLTGAAI